MPEPEVLQEKRGRGQPKKERSRRLIRTVQIKFTEAGFEKVRNAAEEQGFTISTFLRMVAFANIKSNG